MRDLEEKKLALPGHRLIMNWNGEPGYESRMICSCDCDEWGMECTSRLDARYQYRLHLESVLSERGGMVKMQALPWW